MKTSKKQRKEGLKAGNPYLRCDGTPRQKAVITGRAFPKMKRYGRYLPHQGGGQRKLATKPVKYQRWSLPHAITKVRHVQDYYIKMTPEAARFVARCRSQI